MSTLARQVLGASRKRKEPADGFKPPPNRHRPEPPSPKPAQKPSPLGRPEQHPAGLPAKNRLLAGYLAHEFLSRGTLLGQPVPGSNRPEPAAQTPAQPGPYEEVAHLLKFDGTHIPGVVNPTQLGRWIQKGGSL